jgi:hypothetical protein
VLPLEFLHEEIDETIVKVLATKMSITSSCLDFEDTILNCQKGNIEGSTAKIKDEHIALTLNLLIETVGDSGCGGLVDDTKNVETRDDTGIFCCLTLRVVEVGWDCDHGVFDGAAEIRFSGFLHLQENHRRDFFGGKFLGLATVFDDDNGLTALVDDFEGEVLDIRLDLSVVEFATDETLSIEDS